MRVTQRITELCLVSEAGSVPFAVLVEQDGRCALSTAADFGSRVHEQWAGHVLAGKERRPEEWWVMAAWREWLADVSQDAPEQRRQALEHLERSTPGVAIKRPRVVHTRLPVDALAMRWRRDRLHERSEVIGSEIAARLEGVGSVHWSAEVEVNEGRSVFGDWVVATRSASDGIEPGEEMDPEHRRITAATVIRVVDAMEITALKAEWARSREELGEDHPFGIAVVRKARQAEFSELGCIVGDRFPAPVTLAVAAARAYRRRD